MLAFCLRQWSDSGDISTVAPSSVRGPPIGSTNFLRIPPAQSQNIQTQQTHAKGHFPPQSLHKPVNLNTEPTLTSDKSPVKSSLLPSHSLPNLRGDRQLANNWLQPAFSHRSAKVLTRPRPGSGESYLSFPVLLFLIAILYKSTLGVRSLSLHWVHLNDPDSASDSVICSAKD
jgi:hypothetical protein